ncbi:hypothetical protein HCN44_002160 [Aphidius gifuensis]|uniref:Protein inscuteable homologue C-terminal domain-containing protein n=1 Tax=Aphidius gifuensis TaxID=684658 RepID=A0A835CWM7_APHGI|nr:uncharacterized protein LOC122847506 [Aphidius gifuensis]KAF7996528.1 hypothetical protein HCN44_002160 [Aphidius gifuensis]
MSGFKRMQSKVFWSQMAAHDLDNIPLIVNTNPEPPTINVDNSYCNFGRDSDTDNLSDSENKIDNITVINIPIEKSKNDKTLNTIQEEANGICDKEIIVEKLIENKRSTSPHSESHGSLDSGFSDSERSKSTDGTPKKIKRRTKRSRGRPKVNPRLNELWKDNELPPNPTFTSTPDRPLSTARSRQSIIFSNEILSALENDIKQSKRIVENEEETSLKVQQELTQEADCLDDFLYTKEPPEDDVSTSNDSTPSLTDGHWYSRLSNEQSNSSTVSSEKKNNDYHEERCRGSVTAWLNDIVEDYEAECLVTLQSKAMPKRNFINQTTEEAQTRDIRMLTSSATAAATDLLVRADKFSKNIHDVIEKISHLEIDRTEDELLRKIEGEAFLILSELGSAPLRRINGTSLRSILLQLETLKNIVNCALDTRLDFYIERVVRGLEDAPKESGSAARGALAALTALGLAGVRASNSIARCSGIRALLTSLISAGRLSSELRASTLRALSTVCCCPLAINHFVKDGGPEILVDLIASNKSPEKEKMEATALVVQVTAPWTDALGLKYLEPYSYILVNNLTQLAENTKCGQTLLLASAALNNLANSNKCIYAIVECDSIKKLLNRVKKSTGVNIWLMEQVASLIDKLAKKKDIRKYLEKTRASVALVFFLRLAPPGFEDAYERLSITAATALTRLCVDPSIAKQVVAVGGADCLPNLNKPYYNDDDDDDKIGLLKYTKSLRLACIKAAKHIDAAKALDYSYGQ